MAQFAYSKVVSKSSAGIFSLFSTLNTDIADLERQLNDLIEGLVDDNQVSNIVKPVASQIVLGALDEATTDGLMGLCECGEGQLSEPSASSGLSVLVALCLLLLFV